jgi:hypothetical protein
VRKGPPFEKVNLGNQQSFPRYAPRRLPVFVAPGFEAFNRLYSSDRSVLEWYFDHANSSQERDLRNGLLGAQNVATWRPTGKWGIQNGEDCLCSRRGFPRLSWCGQTAATVIFREHKTVPLQRVLSSQKETLECSPSRRGIYRADEAGDVAEEPEDRLSLHGQYPRVANRTHLSSHGSKRTPRIQRPGAMVVHAPGLATR